jgi:hypothetical protein
MATQKKKEEVRDLQPSKDPKGGVVRHRLPPIRKPKPELVAQPRE